MSVRWCSEQWTENDNQKEYYVKNALRFYELNYNVDMNAEDDDFGKLKLAEMVMFDK